MLAPAQLDTAMQALRTAEESFRDEGDARITKDLAYLAMRKAEIAEAAAGLEGANRERAQADKDFKKTQAALLDSAEAEGEATRRQLEAAERARKYLEAQAAAAKAELNKSKAELNRERKAREKAEKKLSAALASLAQVAQVKEEKRGVVITLSGAVLFATGKSALLPIAQSKLDDVAKALKDQGYKKIVVEGHTDSRGSESDNQVLSLRRAESVRSFLISRGIKSDKISSVGLGEQRPVASNKTADGRANNRRVELVVTPE